jgi:predicted Zn-ribbon and HTH transcriptional regulator
VNVAEILTTNQLAEFEASVMRALRGESVGPSLAFVRLVYSSHEALRAALDVAQARIDVMQSEIDEFNRGDDGMDAAMRWRTRATKAEAEADLAAARARVEELEREAVIDLHSTNAIRDDLAAALARVAELEAQRDEARRLYCVQCSPTGSRREYLLLVAQQHWPSEADRLFPDGKEREVLRAEVVTLRSALDNANGVLIATKDAVVRLTKERDDALRVSIARVSAVIRESVDEAAKQLARNVSVLLARDEVLALAHPTCDGCAYFDQGFESPCNTCDKTDYARGVGTDGMVTDNWTEKK